MSALPEGATWVRFPRYVGDAVMHLPLLRLLREVAGTPLVVWGPAATVALVEGTPFADAVLKEADKPGALALARTLRAHRAARSVHFPKSLRPALAAFLARVPERIGVSESLAGIFNTHGLPFWSQRGPAIERYRRVLALRWPALPALPYADYAPPCAAPSHPRPYLCLLPGASVPEKSWGAGAFTTLARRIEAAGFDVVVLGSTAEQALGADVAGERGLNLCSRTSLVEAAAWLRGADGAVGNYSGLAHLAAATGTPLLALASPLPIDKDLEAFRPWGPRVKAFHQQAVGPDRAWEELQSLLRA
jgi:ADP-heptose:LPS heptosyltransferase